MTKFRRIKNKKTAGAFAGVLLLAFLLYTLNFQGMFPQGYGSDLLLPEANGMETPALSSDLSEEAAIRPVKAFHELVLSESGKAEEVQQRILKRSGDGKKEENRKQLGNASLFWGCAAAVFLALLFLCFWYAVPERHLSVISYIHDSDGMKP